MKTFWLHPGVPIQLQPAEEFLAKIYATPQEKLLLILRRRGIFVHPDTAKEEIARLLNYQFGFDEAKELGGQQ